MIIGLSLDTFDTIRRCVRLAVSSTNYQQGDNDYTSQAWVWLEENDLGGVTSTSDVRYAGQSPTHCLLKPVPEN